MVEPRYTLTRDALSLKNRHMIKCYPSFDDRQQAIDEFNRKLRFLKTITNKQGKLLDFLCEAAEEAENRDAHSPTRYDVTFEQRPLTRSMISKRGFSFHNFPRVDTDSWMKKTLPSSSRFDYNPPKPIKGLTFGNLHESTLYINHYC